MPTKEQIELIRDELIRFSCGTHENTWDAAEAIWDAIAPTVLEAAAKFVQNVDKEECDVNAILHGLPDRIRGLKVEPHDEEQATLNATLHAMEWDPEREP
jgi:hypothetical protein